MERLYNVVKSWYDRGIITTENWQEFCDVCLEEIMKKYILPLLGTLCVMFMGCNKATQSMTSDEALQAFQKRVDSFTELVKTYEANPSDSLLAVVEYEYECFVDSSLAIMEQVPNSEANYTILKEIYYSLTTEQKTRAFACVDIDKLEEKTGIDFFCNLPDYIEKDVESKFNLAAWGWNP